MSHQVRQTIERRNERPGIADQEHDALLTPPAEVLVHVVERAAVSALLFISSMPDNLASHALIFTELGAIDASDATCKSPLVTLEYLAPAVDQHDVLKNVVDRAGLPGHL